MKFSADDLAQCELKALMQVLLAAIQDDNTPLIDTIGEAINKPTFKDKTTIKELTDFYRILSDDQAGYKPHTQEYDKLEQLKSKLIEIRSKDDECIRHQDPKVFLKAFTQQLLHDDKTKNDCTRALEFLHKTSKLPYNLSNHKNFLLT